jgi:hypothetical protein
LARASAIKTLSHWFRDPDLASLRDQNSLEILPTKERDQWVDLWDDITVLRVKAVLEPATKQ